MKPMVISPGAPCRTDESDVDEVEWEMLHSDREVTGGLVPFTNINLRAMTLPRPSEPVHRRPPRRIRRLFQCPECAGDHLIPVVAGRKMNFFCQDCTVCWHLDGGEVTKVNPWACPGCALVTTACFERFDISSSGRIDLGDERQSTTTAEGR